MFLAEQTSSRRSLQGSSLRRGWPSPPSRSRICSACFGRAWPVPSVSDLVVELGRAPEPGAASGRPRPRVARPDARARLLAPRLRRVRRRRRTAGRSSRRPRLGRSRSSNATATRSPHSCTTPALSEDPALLDAVSSAAGLALENERLLAELRAQLEEIKNSAYSDRRSRRHRTTTPRTQPSRRRPTASRHALPPPADGPGDAARRSAGCRGDARAASART